MAGERTLALTGVVALATVIAGGAWIVGSRVESPADAAARTAPPAPSPVLVPVEERVLSANIVTRGTGRFGLPHPISIPPSSLKPSPGLIATLPLRNVQLGEGDVLLTHSGRPVFVLEGKTPAYRDLAPGISGEDVRQLEAGLKRLGFAPGSVNGIFDQQTSAAVAKWYQSRKWEPFGPTRDQQAALFSLERDWGEAEKAKLAAETAAAASALAVESVRAATAHSVQAAAADLAAKKADSRRLTAQEGAPLALEAERAKAQHADKAAAAEITAQINERALIVLDPRQPETARAAADAKLELARAAARRTKLEGEAAIQLVERDAMLAAEQVRLAETAVKSARLEGERVVQAALDAQKGAQLDLKLATARAERLGADLAIARQKLGIQVPVDEIVFVPALPVRVEEVTAAVGAPATGPVMTVTDNQLAIDSALALDEAPLVKPDMPVAIDEQALGIRGKGVVQQVASGPGTRGVDGYHVYFEVRVIEASTNLAGVSLRLSIPIETTQGAVLAVPTSAVSLSADGTSRVQVQKGGALEYVTVRPGLSAGGYVEVTPTDGKLAPGQLVVVGYKTPDGQEPKQ